MITSPKQIEEEITSLYEECASGLLRYGIGLNREYAQEALQEAFFRYYVVRTEGQSIENPIAWLYRVLRNYIFDRLKEVEKRNKGSLEEIMDLPDHRQNPEEDYIRSEALWNAESILSPRELECLRLRVKGFGYSEIASILGIRPGTIGATLARALNKIHGLVKTSPKGSKP